MITMQSIFSKKVAVLLIFSFFMISSGFGEVSNQIAFAQENSENVWLGPTTNALTTFFSQVAESLPKVIAAIILLVIGWFVFLFFVMAAVNALEFEQLTVAMTNLWLWLPNLLAFVLIIILGMLLAKFVGKWVEHEIKERECGNPKYFVLAVQIVIYAVVFAIALTQLGVGQEIISILVSAYAWSIAGGIDAAITVGLGFALKDILPGIINSQSKKRSVLKIGQKVQIGDDKGTITAVELLHVILANENNESIVIPTKDLSSKTIRIFGQ